MIGAESICLPLKYQLLAVTKICCVSVSFQMPWQHEVNDMAWRSKQLFVGLSMKIEPLPRTKCIHVNYEITLRITAGKQIFFTEKRSSNT